MIDKIKTFEQAVDYLYQIPRFTAKHSLEETKAHLHTLGNPDKGLRIIHVAGTNGKGSVCAYLRSILEAAGKKVAVFSSPHLVDIRERMVIGGHMVTKEVFLKAFFRVYESLDILKPQQGKWEKGTPGYHPTFFEYLFFMAMLIFEEEGCDFCILETGLGGRLDATNGVSSKVLTIITDIGLDHTEYLGETTEEIAWEKAGILSESCPLVFADTKEEVSAVFYRQAQNLQIPVYPVSKKDYTILNFNNKSIDFSLQSRYYGYIRLTINSIAFYQVKNCALAVRGAELLMSLESLSYEQIQKGVINCLWPGRMEEILPGVYLDGAHNEDGIRAFLDTVEADGFAGKRRLLFGAVSDKDYEKMLALLTEKNTFKSISAVQLRTSRSVSGEAFGKSMGRYPECAYTLYKDTDMALHELLKEQKEDERIYIAGSLYLAGEIKECLGYDKF